MFWEDIKAIFKMLYELAFKFLKGAWQYPILRVLIIAFVITLIISAIIKIIHRKKRYK